VVRDSWSSIRAAEEQSKWEAAWGADVPGFFSAALLADEALAILARYQADQIVAGAVANRSVTVVGLSNVFDVDGDLESAYRGAAGAVQERCGAMPVVG
jgi:hypothetical protein